MNYKGYAYVSYGVGLALAKCAWGYAILANPERFGIVRQPIYGWSRTTLLSGRLQGFRDRPYTKGLTQARFVVTQRRKETKEQIMFSVYGCGSSCRLQLCLCL